MFITFEGLDFCGKSTQVKLIKKYFEDSGKEVELIREPGGVQISEKIRNILLDNKNSEMFSETELLLFSSSRAQLVREKIIPFLKSGKVVISDRFLDSSITYQGFGRGLNKEFEIDLQKFAIGEAVPDLTFFIDIPIAEVMLRKNNILKTDLDRIEVSENEFYENVKKGYEYLAKIEERIITIDGTKSINNIHNEIISIISKH